jgi:hypothetical protein
VDADDLVAAAGARHRHHDLRVQSDRVGIFAARDRQREQVRDHAGVDRGQRPHARDIGAPVAGRIEVHPRSRKGQCRLERTLRGHGAADRRRFFGAAGLEQRERPGQAQRQPEAPLDQRAAARGGLLRQSEILEGGRGVVDGQPVQRARVQEARPPDSFFRQEPRVGQGGGAGVDAGRAERRRLAAQFPARPRVGHEAALGAVGHGVAAAGRRAVSVAAQEIARPSLRAGLHAARQGQHRRGGEIETPLHEMILPRRRT